MLLNVQCMATVVSCILSSVLVVYSERDSSLIVNLSWPETQVCGRALKNQTKTLLSYNIPNKVQLFYVYNAVTFNKFTKLLQPLP